MSNTGIPAIEPMLLQREVGGAGPAMRRLYTLPGYTEQEPISYDEFLARPLTETLEEWVDGMVFPVSTAGELHRQTSAFIQSVLHTFVHARDLGVVRGAPFQIRLARSGRSPDTIFVANPHVGQVKATHMYGAPDVVVEVIAPASAAHDRGEKFYEYEYAGVREYWLIDPERQWAEFYVTDRLGRYQPTVVGDAGMFRSRAVRGFWMRLEWLWEMPQPFQVLRELDTFLD